MSKVLLLDIDGVVCKPQQKISHEMINVLKNFDVYYCTGNSYTRAHDLVGGGKIFCCNGYELRENGKLFWRDEKSENLDPEIEYFLRDYSRSGYGNQIEWRAPSFINYSIIGRYAPWDVRLSHNPFWQEDLSKKIKSRWDVSVTNGAVSVDIFTVGADKSRAAKWVNDNVGNFVFIGDKTEPNGNDYPIIKYVEKNKNNLAFTSTGPQQTIQILSNL